MKKYTKTEIKNMRTNMLQTIVTHFSKDPVALRAVDKKGKCMYYPPKNKPTSIGCALGMYLSWEKAHELEFLFGGGSIVSVLKRENTEKCIPEWMKALGTKFLQDCQDLHDENMYWTITGLSDVGKDCVRSIVRTFNLSKIKM